MKKKLLIPILLLIPVLFLFLFSLKGIIGWYIDNNHTNEMLELVQTKIQKKKLPGEENNSLEEQERTEAYTVDFQELKKMNDEIVGWIQVANTKIDYPIVQHTDNTFYLTHSLNKKKNQAGWVFMDYRNRIDEWDQNTIIYAHGRVDGTMFGSLKELLNKTFLEGKNQLIQISTEDKSLLFQMFSIYVIDTTSDYIETTFKEGQMNPWLEKMKNRSIHNFGMEVNESDKILTLSTCYNKTQKLVVHAKLLQNKN